MSKLGRLLGLAMLWPAFATAQIGSGPGITTVTDGTNTATGTLRLYFTSGATVTPNVGGTVDVAIAGAGSGCTVAGTQYQLLAVNAAGTGCDSGASATVNAGDLSLGILNSAGGTLDLFGSSSGKATLTGGTTGLFTSASQWDITNATASTTTGTGAFVVTGGLGVGGAGNFGGAINTTSASGYQINGTTIINAVGTNGASTVGGLSAGANLPSNDTESTFFGYYAGNAVSGSTTENTGVGWSALRNTTTGTFNSGFGVNNQGANVTGISLTSGGTDSMRDVTTAAHSSAWGVASLRDWNCQFCIAIGENSLRGAADGSSVGGSNTAVGYAALDTTAATSAAANSVFGANAGGTAATTANFNDCFGFNSCKSITTASKDTSFGANSGQAMATSTENAFFGNSSGNAQTASNSAFFGAKSGLVATGANNSFFGDKAGSSVTTGISNLCMGQGACSTTLATGQFNIIIGNSANADAPTAANSDYFAMFGNSATPFITTTGTNSPSTSVTALPGNLSVVATTASTTTGTGALVVTGGVGVGGNINVGGSATFGGEITLASSTTGASTQTFTNSPCSGLTQEKWIPVAITGQSGTWYVPACQ